MTRFTRFFWTGSRALLAAGALTALVITPRVSAARSNGIESNGCEGCHGAASANGKMTLTALPTTFAPGDNVKLSLNITSTNIQAAGVYITTSDVGKLALVSGDGLKTASAGLTHSTPKAASGGSVTFDFTWQAPTTPGAVRFSIYALGANKDGRSSGDNPFDGYFDWVYGCTGQTYYLDSDVDGYGRDDYTELHCADAPPKGFATRGGDCDDYRKEAYPSAPEICNKLDDNCDGKIDENAVPVELWPDADGDGYYDARTEKVGTPVMGCEGLRGYAAKPGDCQPKNKAVNPGVTEVCNGIDDDCDGDVDERVRPTCGEGWCRREAPGCDVAYCIPGEPIAERCNYLDDDCDGQTDEDPGICPEGQSCAAGSCIDSDSVPVGSGGAATSSGGKTSSGTAGKSSGSAGKSSASGAATSSGASGGSTGDDEPEAESETSSGCALSTGGGNVFALFAVLVSLGAFAHRRRRSR